MSFEQGKNIPVLQPCRMAGGDDQRRAFGHQAAMKPIPTLKALPSIDLATGEMKMPLWSARCLC